MDHRDITNEKLLEARLNKKVKEAGGWSIKMLSTHLTGLPDRLCLLPGEKLFFAEIKSPGKKPTKIQKFVMNKIRALGFKVYIIDSIKSLNEAI